MKKLTKNFFKVLFLTLVGVSFMITTGCDKDDDTTDPMVGTWELFEMQMGSEVLDAAALTEMQYSMTVVFTETAYTAVGYVGETINETGTWTRQDENTVIIQHADDEPTTLTKVGDYYTAEFEEGVTGKFRKK